MFLSNRYLKKIKPSVYCLHNSTLLLNYIGLRCPFLSLGLFKLCFTEIFKFLKYFKFLCIMLQKSLGNAFRNLNESPISLQSHLQNHRSLLCFFKLIQFLTLRWYKLQCFPHTCFILPQNPGIVSISHNLREEAMFCL